ncbi:MAG TPA: cellulose biosynthesis protein BcsQ [Acidobacteriaceae bacterium]|jgi:cellulose synthase operon protein YhjQ|nr:cellulose biosynthesis protein BcsQ [Acidobacteriaceae bacterium]
MKREEDERSGGNPENEQADDVATLYSWANLHGAKYRDFSGSRQEARAQLRQRTVDERARLARDEAHGEAPRPEDENDLWETLLPGVKLTRSEPARTDVGTERAVERLADRGVERPGERVPDRAIERTNDRVGERVGERPTELPIDRALERLGRVVEATMSAAQSPILRTPETPAVRTLPPAREEEIAKERTAERPGNGRYAEAESAPLRPAWLGEAEAATPHAPEPETLPSPRERVGSRWFALRGLYGRSQEEAQPKRQEGQVPVLAVFSLAGGVGKTSLVASVGRALSARGEHVLLADTSLFGVLPFYFGAREVKPDVLRTFSGGPSDTPVHLLTLDGERAAADPELLKREVARAAQDANRVLIDVATGSAAMLRQALRLSPTVLVPVVPDMASAVSLQSLETFFRNQEGLSGQPLRAWFVLNQFDPSMPLQLDVREVLRQQLGERLLPFAIHRSTAVSEALAEGMTVIDYAPNSPAAEDIMNLVTWIRNTTVAVTGSQRGMRWSER